MSSPTSALPHPMPPPAVWPKGSPAAAPVSAAARNFFAPSDRFLQHTSGPASYAAWLDRTNRIVHVSEEWDSLAPVGWPRSSVVGRALEGCIADENVHECFRMLLERVRKQDRTASIVSRCDRADRSRATHVTFMPFKSGEIKVTWTLIDGPLAQEVAVVPLRRFHDGEFLRMCSWCRDVHMRTTWQRLDAAAPALGLLGHGTLPPITHGICPVCSAALFAENEKHAEQASLRVAV